VVFVSGQVISYAFPLVIIVGVSMSLLVTGMGLILSQLFIRYEDARNVVGIFLMIALYVTPVFYPISILSSEMQTLINLNPLTSYLEVFRWAFSNNATPTLYNWAYMLISANLVFFFGLYFFKKNWPRTVAML
jgi:ABC-type polysaccharide/polyol phosphate export permease